MDLSNSRTILPLPSDVAACIQSSASITSLKQVILGLVENSLDAHSTRLEIDVDFYRGSCIVEDDGLGIPPYEFPPDGDFGKMHHTSKFNAPQDTVHSRNGTFLASLASLSVLTVTSHHCLHHQTSSVTFHRSLPIATLTSAPVSHTLKSPFHATRVTVRDLFGNMPVRVKQRAFSMQDKIHHNRLWEELKRGLVSLLLSWPEPISLRLKDTYDGRTMMIREPQLSRCELRRTLSSNASRRLSPKRINSLLRQAGLIHVDIEDSWIPASASSKSISVKGVICLKPSPNKQAQFISLGVRPILSSDGRNELFDHVNKLFALSSFGAVREAVELDDADIDRQQEDRRLEADGSTPKELRPGPKGVDRWPMFYLEIQLMDTNDVSVYEKFSAKIDSTLHSITKVLDALVASWLTANHFLIRRRGQKRSHGEESDKDDLAFRSTMTSLKDSLSDTLENRSSRPNSRNVIRKTPIRSSSLSKEVASKSPAKLPFRDFSRTTYTRGPSSNGDVGSTTVKANLPIAPLPPDGCLNPNSIRGRTNSCTESFQELPTTMPTNYESTSKALSEDETFVWDKTLTKENQQLNTPSNQAFINQLEPQRSISAPSIHRCRDLSSHKPVPLSRAKSCSYDQIPPTSNIQDIIHDWKKLAFPTSEQAIPQIGIHLLNSDDILEHSVTSTQIETAFLEASIEQVTKISKGKLRHAKLVAQVDEKFIFVKIPHDNDQFLGYEREQREMLVLIDQHAMDERIKVEELFDQLCQINSEEQPFRSGLGLCSRVNYALLTPPLIFKITTNEAEMLREYATYFADWGILYDIKSTTALEAPADQLVVIVETLSPVIAERLKLEPKLLISLLRFEIWKLSEMVMASETRTGVLSEEQLDDGDIKEHSWLKRIASCPCGIVDMIHSRACRSAVMFNDDLGWEECKELLRKAADCMFPFQCAHGRPSMVPLVSLGSITADEQEMMGRGKGSFIDSYKTWIST